MSSKVGLLFRKNSYEEFLNPTSFTRILEDFYRQNIFGFDWEDLKDGKKITILEFDSNDVPKKPFLDTIPENVEKELLKDYLIPLVNLTEQFEIQEMQRKYLEVQNYGDTAIFNLKEKVLDRINILETDLKDCKHLTPGLKKPLLDSIKRVSKYIQLNISTNFAEDFSENKIKFRLNSKEVCHLMKYLNHKGVFDKIYKDSELAVLIETHFQYQVGSGDEFSNFKDTTQKLSNAIHSASHNSHSEKLKNILKDYTATMNQFKQTK